MLDVIEAVIDLMGPKTLFVLLIVLLIVLVFLLA